MKQKLSKTAYKILNLCLAALFAAGACFFYAPAGAAAQSTSSAETQAGESTEQAGETTGQQATEKAAGGSTEQAGDESEDETADAAEAQLSLEEQKALLESNIKESEEKLAELAEESKVTEEYINALDEKIGALNEQLTVLSQQITQYSEETDALEAEIEENNAAVAELEDEIAEIEAELERLNALFDAKYEAYCIRMRAIYISGSWGIISALLTSGDISGFFTRYEMIKAVSKSDGELLAEIQQEAAEIEAEGSALDQKRAELQKVQQQLTEKKESLVEKQAALEDAQEELAGKKATLSADRAESDSLYAELTAENGMYSEYKNEDSELVAAVEQEIADLINGIISADDVTLATTGERDADVSVEYTYTDVYSNSDAVLNMTYPAPGHYTVSCSFGRYSNGANHTGTDFPCATGSKIVAAQSGQVIRVKRLDYSYGYYVMIYHGTDSSGRSVVTLYAHNSSILVSVGQTVSKGETIALSGSTGNSTGPHCHFEIRLNGTAVNPINYLSK
ncbi:MAG: peptidoglycan DD-metalloendopeptidase family protein [Clostridiales bacterium]|nr:peptidoglycan DD-metalloendopeptidase family protein [Clostridiales bacterium]